MGATLAIFQLSGKQPVAIERLKISQRDSEITGSAIFRKQLAIPSLPHPFDVFFSIHNKLTLKETEIH